MSCQGCLTTEQLYNILNNYEFGSGAVPKGARVTIGLSTYNAYFDSTGKGFDEWEGWAISNGLNGTENRLGRFPVYYDPVSSKFSVAGLTGGAEAVTLTSSELPIHSHSFSLPSHTHPIVDSGHTHTVTEDNQLGLFSILTNSASVVNITNSFFTTLNKQQLRIEDSVAPTNPKTIEVYVPTVNLQAYAGLTSGSDNKLLSGTGSVTVPSHTHSTSPGNLSHAHTHTVQTKTTGISTASNAESFGTTNASGSGLPFSILPPYIVEIPVEKI